MSEPVVPLAQGEMMATPVMNREINDVQLIWQRLRDCLASKKSQLAAEILHYPPPIPACDAQFNFLLAERARVEQALQQLDKLAQTESLNEENLRAFASSSPEWDEVMALGE